MPTDKIQQAAGIFNEAANSYQEKYMDTSVYHSTFDLFCNSIVKSGADVLDIACGPGNITKYLLEKRPDLKILGIDLAPNMLVLARINNPAAEFQLMDGRDIGTLHRKYHGIMCGFCLPYLSKEEAVDLVSDASKILLPGGVLYVSTMEDDYSKSGIQRSSSGNELYMHYHEAGYLCKAFEENGFEIIKLQRISYTSADATPTTDLVIIGIKKQ